MKFDSIDALRAEGFVGFVPVGNLMDDGLDVLPKVKGIYLIIYTKNVHPRFLEIGSGGHFKGKDPNVPIPMLESSWVNGTIVIYIGKTDNTLHKRIGKYINFGKGKPVPHWGGRYIWQIADHRNLLVCWRSMPNNIVRDHDDPFQEEQKLIREFISMYGKMPFANLRM